jgi:3-hydroxyisobutyrate dehydrogenase-like beta-hydroxyacid dehydrogenase
MKIAIIGPSPMAVAMTRRLIDHGHRVVTLGLALGAGTGGDAFGLVPA